MGAVSEMPGPVQIAVRMRIDRGLSDVQIANEMDTDVEAVQRLIDQGQAILDRALGPEFTIEHLPYEDGDEEERFDWPTLDDEEANEPETELEQETQTEYETEVGAMIARSVDALTSSAEGDGEYARRARRIITEALRDAGDLFRIAAQRINSYEESFVPLREVLSHQESEELTLIVEHPGDAARLFVQLDAMEQIDWVKAVSLAPEMAEFQLMVNSSMSLLTALMELEGEFKPSRLHVDDRTITFELANGPLETSSSGEPVSVVSMPTNGAHGPRMELSVDAFFGARHFITSDGEQGPPHHHSYRVEASIGSPDQNADGFVLGFANAREMVESTVMEFSETLLNTTEPFIELQPTTENLAKVLHERIRAQLNGSGAWLQHVRVWESPTNSATYSDVAITA